LEYTHLTSRRREDGEIERETSATARRSRTSVIGPRPLFIMIPK
jgi:hypothetical protein